MASVPIDRYIASFVLGGGGSGAACRINVKTVRRCLLLQKHTTLVSLLYLLALPPAS
jgi:hypothetical protein